MSSSDRARQTARRKAIYEELHPETINGVNQHSSLRQLGEPSAEVAGVANFATRDAERFTANTAKATGASERAVQRDAERGQKILPEVLDMIAGTPLDTGAYMDRVKNLPGSQQVRAAKRDLAFERSREREAKKKAAAQTPAAKAKRAAERIMREWLRAGADGQAIFKKEAGLVGIVRPTKSLNGRPLGTDKIPGR